MPDEQVDDPALAAAAPLTPEDFSINTATEKSLILTNVPGYLLATVAQVFFRNAQTMSHACVGTAFCVTRLANGQCVYVTARHVIDDVLASEAVEPFLLLPKSTSDPSRFEDRVAIKVDRITTSSDHCDLALLRIDLRTAVVPMDDVDIRTFPLDVKEAVLGQKTMALGYSIRRVGDGGTVFLQGLRGSEGTVEDVHNTKRDSSLSTFPSFRTDGLYLSGMSGGAVFNEGAGVIGVISHGIVSEDGGPHCGYAASIGGLGELSMALEQDDGSTRDFTFPELVAEGIVKLASQGGVTLERDDAGLHLVWLPSSEPGDPV